MPDERVKKPRKVSDQEIRETILVMCQAAGPAGRVRPEAVCQAILPEHWQTLTKRVRLTSRQLAQAGELIILRKGEPADPEDVKGLIHLRIAPEGPADTSPSEPER